jgi:predicted ATP-grasp superfamily ATP-dependent carboligase
MVLLNPSHSKTMTETLTVIFHVDSAYVEDLEDLDFKVTASQEDPGAVAVIVAGVDEVLIESLQDDELAEFFGIPSEGLIYTDRNVLA